MKFSSGKEKNALWVQVGQFTQNCGFVLKDTFIGLSELLACYSRWF